jgi:acetyl-CoA carboxylase biotin carboxyl carrier protein
MKEQGLIEVDLRQGQQQIRLSRGGVAPALVPHPLPAAVPVPSPAAPAAAAAKSDEQDAHIVLIRSPMVGTFYSKANPHAEAFVKVGDHVNEETTVCIIEAMKVFNEIPAEVRGRVVAMLVDDEEPVDYGRPLFKVDTRS